MAPPPQLSSGIDGAALHEHLFNTRVTPSRTGYVERSASLALGTLHSLNTINPYESSL